MAPDRLLPEYLMEAAGLGLFMASACVFTVLLEHPGSPVRQLLPDAFVRRALVGLAMGATAVAIIYSPWGQQSGAHINPSVTLAFWRLGKIAPRDAFFYVVAQFAGATVGVLACAVVLDGALADATVRYVITVPGTQGIAAAFAAEGAISFGLMLAVLTTSNHPSLAQWTGVAAGILVAAYVTFEAPLSGMSMNPARTFGSAAVAREFTSFWLYVCAPLLGMLGAAEVYTRALGPESVACAKLHHDNDKRCIFCDYRH